MLESTECPPGVRRLWCTMLPGLPGQGLGLVLYPSQLHKPSPPCCIWGHCPPELWHVLKEIGWKWFPHERQILASSLLSCCSPGGSCDVQRANFSILAPVMLFTGWFLWCSAGGFAAIKATVSSWAKFWHPCSCHAATVGLFCILEACNSEKMISCEECLYCDVPNVGYKVGPLDS